MERYEYWNIEYNPCLYRLDRQCGCSTIEDDINEQCVSCLEKICKTPKCNKNIEAINKYNIIKDS